VTAATARRFAADAYLRDALRVVLVMRKIVVTFRDPNLTE